VRRISRSAARAAVAPKPVAATEVLPTLTTPASLRYALGVIPVTRRNVVVK